MLDENGRFVINGKSVLLELLNDASIQKRIREIVGTGDGNVLLMDRKQYDQLKAERDALQADNIRLQAEQNALQADNARLQTEQNALQADNVRLQAERDALRAEHDRIKQDHAQLQAEKDAFEQKAKKAWTQSALLQEEADKRQKLLNMLEKKIGELAEQNRCLQDDFAQFADMAALWTELQRLDGKHIDFLSNLCGENSARAYFSLGRDFSKIAQLWQYVRDYAVNDRNPPPDYAHTVETLNRFFRCCIEVYNLSQPESGRFAFDDAEVGAKYDSEQCFKTAESQLNGRIITVLVSGAVNPHKRLKSIVKIQ